MRFLVFLAAVFMHTSALADEAMTALDRLDDPSAVNAVNAAAQTAEQAAASALESGAGVDNQLTRDAMPSELSVAPLSPKRPTPRISRKQTDYRGLDIDGNIYRAEPDEEIIVIRRKKKSVGDLIDRAIKRKLTSVKKSINAKLVKAVDDMDLNVASKPARRQRQ